MTPYEADLEGMQKSTLSVDCPNIANVTCHLYLTYEIRKPFYPQRHMTQIVEVTTTFVTDNRKELA